MIGLLAVTGPLMVLSAVIGYRWGSATALRRRLWSLDHRGPGPLAAKDERTWTP